MLSQINHIQAPTTEHVCELRIRLVNQQTKQHFSIRDLKAIDGSREPGLESDMRTHLRVVIRRLDLLCAHNLSTVSAVRYTGRTIHHGTEVIHSTSHLQSHRELTSAAETPVKLVAPITSYTRPMGTSPGQYAYRVPPAIGSSNVNAHTHSNAVEDLGRMICRLHAAPTHANTRRYDAISYNRSPVCSKRMHCYRPGCGLLEKGFRPRGRQQRILDRNAPQDGIECAEECDHEGIALGLDFIASQLLQPPP